MFVLMVVVFVLGYVAIALEHPLKADKAATALLTGTGGSILIIGSAAGVAAMGMEKIDFIWYMKRISLLAMAGYFGGALVFYLLFG